MTTSEMVRTLCRQRHVSLSELARRVGQSPQNFSKKLQRETLTLDELNQISNALGVGFEQSFVLPGGDRITTNYSEDSAEVVIIDEFDVLLSAMTEEFPLCIFSNLTRNSYHIFEYDKFTTKRAAASGTYDELIRISAATIPNEKQRNEFSRLFSRKNLLALNEEGQKSVRINHLQTGDDGTERWMESCSYFRRAQGSGDVVTITTSKCIDDDVKTIWQSRIGSTLAEDFEVVYLVDAETGKYSVERLSEKYGKIIGRLPRETLFFAAVSGSIDMVVHPEDREMMHDCLQRENVLGRLRVSPVFYVNFRCLVDGVVSHYEMKVAKADDRVFGNKIVLGIHDRSEAENARLLEKTNTSVREALAGDYSSVLYVDARTRRCTSYMFDEDFIRRFRRIISNNSSFNTVLSLYVNNMIHPEDRKEFLAVFQPENLEKHLKETRAFSFMTRKLVPDGFRYNEVKIMRVGEAGAMQGFIVGVSDNDEMIRKELAMAELNKSMLAVTSTLAGAYLSVMTVNITDGNAWVCSMGSRMKEFLGDIVNSVIPVYSVASDFMARLVPEDQKKFYDFSEAKHVRRALSQSELISENFRISYKGEVRMYRVIVGRFGDGSDPDKVVVACLDCTNE